VRAGVPGPGDRGGHHAHTARGHPERRRGRRDRAGSGGRVERGQQTGQAQGGELAAPSSAAATTAAAIDIDIDIDIEREPIRSR
jgi:hypothetical protein